MIKYPVYDEESGQCFESAAAAGRALFRSAESLKHRLEYIEGMRIIRPYREAHPTNNSGYLQRRLRALYPLAYTGGEK